MIKAIVFDCFGVLATDIWLAFCDSLPPGVDLQQASDLNKAFDRGMISHEEFVTRIEELTGKTPPDIETMSAGQLGKNTALLEFIKTLQPHYKIGILSNISSDWITDTLLSSDDQRLFDTMVFSHQVGMVKPDPRIYQLVCDKLGVQSSEAVMVDDRQGYVTVAQDIGMQGIVYVGLSEFKQSLQMLLDSNN